MKRIESFLNEYSWLFKSGIWVLLILWAAQANFVFVDAYNDIKNQPPRNFELEKKLTKELSTLYEQQLREAKEMGKLYGPYDYFEDYKERESIGYRAGMKYPFSLPLDNTLNELQALARNNTGDGKRFSYEDFNNAAGIFREWIDRGGSCRDEFYSHLEDMGLEAVLLKICGWVSSLYFRGFGLALFLYLVRMSDYLSKGILETVLADKKRFLAAVFLWPFFLMKYPSNVVREIVVEAELRRMGNLFRKFTFEERKLVRSVAESADFWSWIFRFHSENRGKFQRSLVAALAVTIFINLIPFQAKAGELDRQELTRDGPEIVSVADYHHQDSHQEHITEAIAPNVSSGIIVIFSTIPSFFRQILSMAKGAVRSIDHVPITTVCLSVI
ncbi:MAG: hypothetical protein WC120_00350 [Parcubacteria group bacterium]